MKKSIWLILIAFASGCIGGLANSFVSWLFGYLHVTSALGVKLAPDFTSAWLYQRMVWGGVWAMLLLVPILSHLYFLRGLLISLVPSIVQLFVFFPLAGMGYLGLSLGNLTPLFVLIYNGVWGVVASYLFYNSRQELLRRVTS